MHALTRNEYVEISDSEKILGLVVPGIKFRQISNGSFSAAASGGVLGGANTEFLQSNRHFQALVDIYKRCLPISELFSQVRFEENFPFTAKNASSLSGQLARPEQRGRTDLELRLRRAAAPALF